MPPELESTASSPPSAGEATWFFFRRWLADPLAVAMPLPSSRGVRALVSRNIVCGPDECVVEFGAGTGSITRAMLDAGVPPERVFTIEIDRELADFTRRAFPGVNVIHGDARDALSLIGEEWRGKTGTVMVGIPVILLPPDVQRGILDTVFTLLAPGRQFLQLTFSFGPPVPMETHGLQGKRLGWAWTNLMPLSVWGFTRAEPGSGPGAA